MRKDNWITFESNETSVCFKRKYLLAKETKKVSISITAMGWYNLFVNSNRVDQTAFAPGWTSYYKRIQYYVYDITNFVQNGTLDIKVDIGNGWAGADRIGCINSKTNPSYYPKSLNYEIAVEYTDGSKETFVSDESVEVFNNEIIFNDLYDGEIQDQLREIRYLGKAIRTNYDTKLIPQEGEDIVYAERIPAKELFVDSEGNTVIDFGQNFAGNIEINIDAKNGDTLSFVPGEVLNEKGAFYNANYRSAKSFFSFKLSKDKKVYMARFSFMGGRYIKLIDFPKGIKKENFTGVLIHSKLEKTGYFECGNSDLQRLYLNSVYGQLSNYLDVPTDCPQRDERLGWTADTQVFCSTAAIHYNVDKFLSKWINDLVIDQQEDGCVPAVAPFPPKVGWNMVATGWGDAITVVPIEMYKAYKNTTILENSVEAMKKWVQFELSHKNAKGVIHFDFSFGDWCALDRGYGKEFQGLTDYDLVDTAYTCYSLSNLIQTLEVLKQDASQYIKVFEELKKAYQDSFIKDGHMVGPRALIFSQEPNTANTQTGIVFSLFFNLCREEDRNSLLNDLVQNIKDCENRLTTGFLGTPLLLHTLSNNGRSDVAYDLLFQTRYPSWLYSVKKGATTFWEHYDGIKEDNTLYAPDMNSYNHYAYGSVYNWMFNNIAGIQNISIGYDDIVIKPLVDKRVGYVNCSFKSIHGTISSSWRYLDENHISFKISVPNNTKSTIIFPDRKTYTFESANQIEYTMDVSSINK